MQHPKRNAFLLILGIAIGFALAQLAAGPSEEELIDQHYCKMVEMYHADPTRTTGWPDFNNNYEEVCGNAAR